MDIFNQLFSIKVCQLYYFLILDCRFKIVERVYNLCIGLQKSSSDVVYAACGCPADKQVNPIIVDELEEK